MQKRYSDLIKQRISIRSYEHAPLPDDKKSALMDYLSSLGSEPLGTNTRFALIEAGSMGQNAVKLGTYGFIKGAYSFIASATNHEEFALESLGYQMEKIVLKATELGLGTCWLGGTFNRGSFAKAMELGSDEFLPIITSVGNPSDQKRFMDKLIRRGAQSDRRKAFESVFFMNNFSTSLSKESAGKYYNAFEMVRMAPSASNKQPWLLVLDSKNDVIHLYLNRLNNYTGNKMGFEMQKIDIGIAMCHLELALSDDGITGEFYTDSPKIKLPEYKDSKVSYEISFKIK